MKEGYGYYKWADGSTYNGDWSQNMISGIGIQTWRDGRRYEGEFVNNKMEGFGYYRFDDGKTYLGFYQNDKKQGYGIYTWPKADGKQYSGWWTNGKQDGYGILSKGTPISTSDLDAVDEDDVRYGVWKDGTRIRWLGKDEVENIIVLSRFRLNVETVINKLNREQCERLSFEKPQGFEETANRVRRAILRYEAK